MDWTRKVNPVTMNPRRQDSRNRSSGKIYFPNQLANRDVPAFVDILGASLAATVSVNGTNANRKGEYFWDELPVNNTNSALWTNIIVAASGQTSVTGHVFVAQEPETFKYDADGNLTNDGRWAYTWDGENRLIQMTVNANVGPQYQLNFAYDSQGRRIQKIVSTNNGTSFVGIYTNNFLYDGWNLIAVLTPASSLVNSFVWSTDLSDSLEGAGGVGELLEVSYHGTSTTNCFSAFDGNGNVAALINAADGTIAANYEYGPFGEPIRITGAMANNNPFLFSTKYYDSESALYYYGYRFYNPSTGTWQNRDSLEEEGGANLYEFANNNPENYQDELGCKSESADLSILRHEAVDWRVQGWKFAPNLLTAFITKAGGYSPSSYDINLIKTSQLYRDTAQKYFQALFEKICTTGSTGTTGTAGKSAASGAVSKIPISDGKSLGPYAFEPRYDSGELFYALGGAHFYYTGFMVYCCSSKIWAVHVTMTQEDKYTFAPTTYGLRQIFQAYRAGHELELTYHYPPFWHSETWDDRFKSK